jgi:glycogen operon protein
VEFHQKSAQLEASSPEVIHVSYPYPLGSSVTPEGTNFSVFSAGATGVEIVFFDHADDAQVARAIAFDPVLQRTAHYWHIFVPDIRPGQLYGYRVDGPHEPSRGFRFDRDKILLDPYARSVSVSRNYSRDAASRPGDNAASCMKSVVADVSQFEWEDDKPLNTPFSQTIIYEMHVAGFTCHPSSGVSAIKRGTYLGVVEKIPYLKQLGITAVELLPVFQFDAQDTPGHLSNYWGYDPISLFAPHLAYCTSEDPLTCLDEFRTMVKELHRANIEVILDVVYNHTGEGNEDGPTLCFKGLENSFYYILNADATTYANYTGTGNTLKANHSVVKRLILDSLKYWVSEMHVDGFRFDLASIFSRDESGEPMLNAPIVWEIDSEPLLAGAKLIAEAWDAGGLYQVGSFGGDKWKEWNGSFRDCVRGFIKGDQATAWRLRDRIIGSPDIYHAGNRPAGQSLNFVTCHDGFTLNDLVSYSRKHNEANLQNNEDGTNSNLSWNCGVEGPSGDSDVELLRMQQIKNMIALTLLSVGTPMLLMGDEIRRTQDGNNNAYCQDNETSWMNWDLCKANADLLRFVRLMTRLRLHFNDGFEQTPLDLGEFLKRAQVEWHGTELGKPDWGLDSHSVALTLHNPPMKQMRYIALNSYWEPLEFKLPQLMDRPVGSWLRIIDTALPSPMDIAEDGVGYPLPNLRYCVRPRSLVMLRGHYS